MTDIAPCPRCGYGAGPQGAERYWEARWRDEARLGVALVTALESLLDRYTGLVNCGDCGFWDPEKEREVIDARAALASIVGAVST